jgi:hypothetical protein
LEGFLREMWPTYQGYEFIEEPLCPPDCLNCGGEAKVLVSVAYERSVIDN